MKELMPDSHGDWIDRGPARSNETPEHEASQVRVLQVNATELHTLGVWPPRTLDDVMAIRRSSLGASYVTPHDPKSLREVVKQGHERPRPLTADETSLVNRNRTKHVEDRQSMEAWYGFHGAGLRQRVS